MVQRCASSAMASCAWRLVPTNSIVLPWLASSLTNLPASRNILRVFCRSMMWIPLRSPKIYSFIFGFQRLVWWPKCTPASSRSFIAIAAKSPPLSFAELEALAGSRHAVLLPFLGARVARQQAFVLQLLAQLDVVLDERARDAESHRARLSRHAAP